MRGKFPERCKAWFHKTNPLGFKWKEPLKGTMVLISRPCQAELTRVLARRQVWSHPVCQLPSGRAWLWRREERKEWVDGKQTVTHLGVQFFHILTCMPSRAWKLEQKRPHPLGRRNTLRRITRTDILLTLSHKMQTLRWTRRQHISLWAYIYCDIGSMLCDRICHQDWCKWLQKGSQHIWSQFWNHESLVSIQVLSVTSRVTWAKYLTSPAPQFPYL